MTFSVHTLQFFGLFMFICLGLAGCTRYQGSDVTEQKHPKLISAHEQVQVQDLDGAEEILLEFLYEHPDYALTHLRLGMLYQSKKEPLKAVYHFQVYLEQRPDSDKATIINQLIEIERQRIGSTAAQAPIFDVEATGGDPVQALQQQLSDTQQKLAEAEVHLQQLRVRRGEVSQTPPPDWAVEKLALLEEIRAMKSQQTPAVVAAVAPESPNPENKTYTVKRGDTLSRISQKVYGEASKWRVIYDANRDKIPNQNALKLGTLLVIP